MTARLYKVTVIIASLKINVLLEQYQNKEMVDKKDLFKGISVLDT